jgi:hypothetical protein
VEVVLLDTTTLDVFQKAFAERFGGHPSPRPPYHPERSEGLPLGGRGARGEG